MINATLFESSDWLVNHKLPYQLTVAFIN